jgi:hypothetical protein
VANFKEQSDINLRLELSIYLLNLDSRTDRLENMTKRLKKNNITNYKRFSAINGKLYPYNQQWRSLKFFFESVGAYGVLVSAYGIILDAIQNKYKKILILEDDAIFHENFTELFEKQTSNIPEYWKLLYLGSSMHKWRIQSRCRSGDGYLIPQGSIPGAFALGISYECYLPLIQQILSFRSAWDLGPLKYINTIFKGQCNVLYPNIIIADTRDSDIREAKNLQLKSNDCCWDLYKYDFS